MGNEGLCFSHILGCYLEGFFFLKLVVYKTNYLVVIMEVTYNHEHYKRKGCFKWVFKYSPSDKIIRNDLYGDFQ